MFNNTIQHFEDSVKGFLVFFIKNSKFFFILTDFLRHIRFEHGLDLP